MCQAGSTFKRTRYDRTYVCSGVTMKWGTAVEHMKVSSYTTLCLCSNIHNTFERRAQSKMLFFFFFTKIFTK
jgi:hypothetical protein